MFASNKEHPGKIFM